MPFGGLLSLGAAGLSIGGSLSGLLGGGGNTNASNVQIPHGYNYGNIPGADANAYGGIGELSNYNVAGGLLPQYQQIAQSAIQNPYAPSYQQNAATTGQQGFNSGQQLTQSGLSTLPDAQALISLGFDPQNALYSQLQNQNQQQNAAILGQSGVAQTPYGAGVAANANSNFNINWQNQQLGRAVQGAQGAEGLLQQAGNTTNTGLAQMAQGAALPYNTFQGINANALNTLGQVGQFGQSGSVLPQQQIQDYLSYLQSGQGQQGINQQNSQLALQQTNLGFNQNQTLGNQLGGGLASLGRATTGWGSSASTPNYGQSYNIAGGGYAGMPVF